MKRYKSFSAFLIALAIGIGAFGAHVLNPGLEERYIRTLSTANLYFLFHSLALFTIALNAEKNNVSFLKRSYWILFIGVFFFSGSLYIIVLSNYFDFDLPSIVGPCTPAGGLLLIVGWIYVAYSFFVD